jgi:hypothetical protein
MMLLLFFKNIGNTTFRSLQNEIIESVLQGQDTFAVQCLLEAVNQCASSSAFEQEEYALSFRHW